MSLPNSDLKSSHNETVSSVELKLVENNWTKARFLNKNDELFMLLIPWLGIVLSLGFSLLNYNGFNLKVDQAIVLLVTLIFADSFHVVFTFIAMLLIPELRQWTQRKESQAKTGWLKGKGPWEQAFLIGLALAAIVIIVRLFPATASLKGMVTLWLFFEMFGPAQHTVAQMRGISLCYNSAIRKKYKFNELENQKAKKVEQWERQLFNILFAGEVLFWIPQIFLKDGFSFSDLDSVQILGGIFILVSSIGLMINTRLYPHQDKTNKMAFQARVLLFPLKMVNMVGSIFIRAAHGTEYTVIFRRMVNGSKIEKTKKTKIFLTTVFVSLVYLIPYLTGWITKIPQTSHWTITENLVATALFGTFIIRFVHYYLDSVMFKMSDSNTRATMAPLLTQDPN